MPAPSLARINPDILYRLELISFHQMTQFVDRVLELLLYFPQLFVVVILALFFIHSTGLEYSDQDLPDLFAVDSGGAMRRAW